MNRLPPLILAVAMIGAAVVAGAPAGALAQTWPAGVITTTGTFVPQASALATTTSDAARLRAVYFRVVRAEPAVRPALKLRAVPSTPDEIPTVDLRPKDEWVDDQGISVSVKRVAFKRRF